MLLNSYYYNVNYYYKLLAIVHVSEITWQTVYVTIQSHVTHVVSGSSVQ